MGRFIPWLASRWFAASVFASLQMFIDISAVIAHQQMALGEVEAMVHLEPDDSPYAGEPSPTWIHLLNANGETIRLADCTCNLKVYDSQNQPLAIPNLVEAAMEGRNQLLTTSITFPAAGAYKLVLTGQSPANKFEPFELVVPVTVRP
ncbi:hypothetical protein IFO70_08660 [Phormidium tenue FACHB-886]|nr:hypothetical protein [Phormidium tenue FACHB-886]